MSDIQVVELHINSCCFFYLAAKGAAPWCLFHKKKTAETVGSVDVDGVADGGSSIKSLNADYSNCLFRVASGNILTTWGQQKQDVNITDTFYQTF